MVQDSEQTAAVVAGRGWARVGSMPPAGMGPSGEQDTTRQGLVVLYPPRIQPALGLHPQDITAPEPARGPMSHGSNPASGCAGQKHSIIYHLRRGAVLGMGERLMGGGDRPLSEEQRACFSWQVTIGGREPSLRTHGVRHHHHINNERAAPSKLFAPAPARAQNAEEAREPHPKQPRGERCDARPVLCWAADPG